MRPVGAGALLAVLLSQIAAAHRLDEYLQATLIDVTRKGVNIEIQLTPGVAIFPVILAAIDRDRNGRISAQEESAYANRVLREVELRIDGEPAVLRLIGKTFPSLEDMRGGLGAIRLKLRADRAGHSLEFVNRHLPEVSVYLVNCLASQENGLIVQRQERDVAQKSIRFEYSFP